MFGACSNEAADHSEPELAPAPAEVRLQCQSAADALGFAVPCPTLLPSESKPTSSVDGACPGRVLWIGTACGDPGAGAFASIEFERPANGAPGHLVIEATAQALSPSDAVNYPLTSSDRQITLTPRGTMDVAGNTGDLFEVAEDSGGPFSGHTVVVWTAGGHTYVAGIHGADSASLLLNDNIIEGLVMVTPQ